jgi:hypothetical protein
MARSHRGGELRRVGESRAEAGTGSSVMGPRREQGRAVPEAEAPRAPAKLQVAPRQGEHAGASEQATER